MYWSFFPEVTAFGVYSTPPTEPAVGTYLFIRPTASALRSWLGITPVLNNPFVSNAPLLSYALPKYVPAGHIVVPVAGQGEAASPNMAIGETFGFVGAAPAVFGGAPLKLKSLKFPARWASVNKVFCVEA